jgi:ribosomal protein L11 methylase PrmA
MSIPSAVRIARERVASRCLLAQPMPCGRQWADVIVANIDAATLESIAPELARVRKPNSTLILSGFPEWDVPEGFSPKEILRLEEWRCFVC